MPELDALSRDDLIRLILELQRQIEDLRKQNEELRRKDKRSSAVFQGRAEEESEAAGTPARARRVFAPAGTARRRQQRSPGRCSRRGDPLSLLRAVAPYWSAATSGCFPRTGRLQF